MRQEGVASLMAGKRALVTTGLRTGGKKYGFCERGFFFSGSVSVCVCVCGINFGFYEFAICFWMGCVLVSVCMIGYFQILKTSNVDFCKCG